MRKGKAIACSIGEFCYHSLLHSTQTQPAPPAVCINESERRFRQAPQVRRCHVPVAESDPLCRLRGSAFEQQKTVIVLEPDGLATAQAAAVCFVNQVEALTHLRKASIAELHELLVPL